MNNSQAIVSRVFTVITVVALVFALNVSGALAGFWRSVGSVNPTEFLFGYGQGDSNTFGYGYGYGYGQGDYDAGYLAQFETQSTRTPSDGGVTATIPAGTTITRADSASGATLDPNDITVTQRSNSAITLSNSITRSLFDFGITDIKMNFSTPIEITTSVGTEHNGKLFRVGVRHYGDSSFGTSGLTTNPNDTCNNGVAGTTGNNYTVVGGNVTLYTCSASEFIVYETQATSASGGGTIPTIENDSNVNGGSNGGSSNNGGSNGGSTDSRDNCPDGDLSGSRYDNTCLAVNSGNNTDDEDEDETDTDEVSGTDEEDTIRNEGSCSFPTLLPNYTDINDSWARSYIRDLSKRGIINGVDSSATNPGGEFQPERAVTRAEFLKIATKSFCYDYSDLAGNEDFADVENGSWVAQVTELAGALGVIDTTNTNFRPNDAVSKIEAMKMILLIAETRSTNFTVDDTVTITSFIDVTMPWMKKYAAKSEALGIIDGNGGMFEPTIAITRAQTSKIAVRSMNAQ